MKIVQSAFVLALVTGVFAAPVLQDSSNEITKPLTEGGDVIYSVIGEKREAELDFSSKFNHLEARAQIKDTKCPINGKTYTKADITRAVEAENNKTHPDTYNNVEAGGPLFQTTEQLYKARMDNTVRAVFSKKNGKYAYKGLIEHEVGLSNGFHRC